MADLVFYEKPGCVGNARQKSLLRKQGVAFQVRDLLRERWTAERLRAFFGANPVAEWFNPSAPRVKSGELRIESMGEREALDLMLREPILIRRPLLELGGMKQSGFLPGPVLDALGIDLHQVENLQDCPADAGRAVCDIRQ